MPDFPAAAAGTDERSNMRRAGLFALAYFVGAELAYALSLGPSVGGTFWPPAGIALGTFLVMPRRQWAHLLLAGAIANFVSDQLHGQTLAASLAFIAANISEPLVGALEHARVRAPQAQRIYLTPQGERFSQNIARELAAQPGGLILLCGRYEGIDERVRDGWIDRELSVGDFVLTGGEPAALIIIDAVTRLLPGVLGNEASLEEESFWTPRLEYPHYTRPREFQGRPVPEVLLSGHHAKIMKWRREQSEQRTRERRPDLLIRDEDDPQGA